MPARSGQAVVRQHDQNSLYSLIPGLLTILVVLRLVATTWNSSFQLLL